MSQSADRSDVGKEKPAGRGHRVLCPFCGAMRSGGAGACARCGETDSEAARQAALARMGPWYVLNPRNPAAAGVSLAAMRRMIRMGEVSRGSVVRGPTTGQFWQHAVEVKGLSREFGLCYLCHEDVDVKAERCVLCGASQVAPDDAERLLEVSGKESGAGPMNVAAPTNVGAPVAKAAAATQVTATPVVPGPGNGPVVGSIVLPTGVFADRGGAAAGRENGGSGAVKNRGSAKGSSRAPAPVAKAPKPVEKDAGEGSAILTADQLKHAFRLGSGEEEKEEGEAPPPPPSGKSQPWRAAVIGGVLVLIGVCVAGAARPEIGHGAGAWAERQVDRVSHYLGTLRGGGE